MQKIKPFSENSTAIKTEAKWDRINEKKSFSLPCAALLENSFLLPKQGTALDLACGLGENSLFIAGKGLRCEAWDISSIALKKLAQKSLDQNLKILVKQVDICANVLPKNSFDVIVLSRFLDRSLSNAIIDSLKQGGLLFYQTYTKEKIAKNGPKNPQYLLDSNELLAMFQPLKVIAYKEYGLLGNLQHGDRNEAYFIGQKAGNEKA